MMESETGYAYALAWLVNLIEMAYSALLPVPVLQNHQAVREVRV